jgi:hypothetical protein
MPVASRPPAVADGRIRESATLFFANSRSIYNSEPMHLMEGATTKTIRLKQTKSIKMSDKIEDRVLHDVS